MMSQLKVYITGITSILTICLISSCENQNKEDLFGISDCDTTQVSYSGYVQPLLENHCYICHAGPNLIAPFSLEGYDNVKLMASSGQLYGALNHLQGYQNMPRGKPKLPECDLAKINKWIREDAPNN